MSLHSAAGSPPLACKSALRPRAGPRVEPPGPAPSSWRSSTPSCPAPWFDDAVRGQDYFVAEAKEYAREKLDWPASPALRWSRRPRRYGPQMAATQTLVKKCNAIKISRIYISIAHHQ